MKDFVDLIFALSYLDFENRETCVCSVHGSFAFVIGLTEVLSVFAGMQVADFVKVDAAVIPVGVWATFANLGPFPFSDDYGHCWIRDAKERRPREISERYDSSELRNCHWLCVFIVVLSNFPL